MGDSMAGAEVEQRTTAMIRLAMITTVYHPVSSHGLFEFMFMTSYDVDAIIILRKTASERDRNWSKALWAASDRPGIGVRWQGKKVHEKG